MIRKILFIFLLGSGSLIAQTKKQITLEDIWLNGTFASKGVPGFNFMKNGKYYTETEEGNLLKKEVTTGKTVATLVNKSDLTFEGAVVPINEYVFSENE